MSAVDERVWQLRNGIIQRLNNPEGIQEEEVDALIFAAQEQERKKIRESGVLIEPSYCFFDFPADAPLDGPIYAVPVSVLAPGELL